MANIIKLSAPGVKISSGLADLFIKIKGADAGVTLASLAKIIRTFREQNSQLLEERVSLQAAVDGYFKRNKNTTTHQFTEFLRDSGYITENSQDVLVSTADLPPEIAVMAGPQLVVPADKANMVLNAANARWGSLYNVLYSSNVIDPAIKDAAARRAAVTEYTYDFLDKIAPFEHGVKWRDIKALKINKSELPYCPPYSIAAINKTDANAPLTKASHEKVFAVNAACNAFILENNGLKIEIKLDEGGVVKDVLLESAITYIIDLEDASISAPENKIASYYNILGIINGDLTCEVEKSGITSTRKMAQDSNDYFNAKTGKPEIIRRTATALVRDVGPHMTADKALMKVDGQAVPEKILDCFITSLLGMRYHVAPKMHGAKEVAFNVELWDAVNAAQNLPENANKMGIMVEEMRMSAQLNDAIGAAREITFFTNTGFLDYTASYIDLMMQAGPIAPFSGLARATYKTSYEQHNVEVSLGASVPQIGAGMWPETRNLAGLLPNKIGQIKGLTDTGWSPSPQAATIHAMAFHMVNARELQAQAVAVIKQKAAAATTPEALFEFPKLQLNPQNPTDKTRILDEVDLAVHGLLAYAEPWVRRGVGCSSIKDRHNVELMEDRATARIKAAFLRNWLHHGVVTLDEINSSIARMSKEVDRQNGNTKDYQPLYTDNSGPVEQVVAAVSNAIFNPLKRPDSYIEPYFYPAYVQEQEIQQTKKKSSWRDLANEQKAENKVLLRSSL